MQQTTRQTEAKGADSEAGAGRAAFRPGLAVYASDARRTRGRLHPEAPSPTRSDFQRDRDRVIHSTAFRRLKHKTQVFVYHEGDHYRTRLTHTIEVAQIARTLARSLGLDEDLAEILALAHDLGHPPFGHAGERALDEAMARYGGFDHNAQALRVVTRLEARYAAFDGLNLTWETLEGLVKHNGPLVGADGSAIGPYAARGVPETIRAFDDAMPLDLASHASLEAQCAAIADDIAYDSHDTDDGLRAGLFHLDAMADAVPLIGRLVADVDRVYGVLPGQKRIHEVVRRVITCMIEDVLGETGRRIADRAPRSVEEVRAADAPLVVFSDAFAGEVAVLKRYLFDNMYRAPWLNRVMADARGVVGDLFDCFMREPGALPEDWRAHVGAARDASRARRVSDYIAGMTDRYALQEHRRLFDVTPELR